MANDTIQVRVSAQIDNYEKVVETIKQGVEKGLVDGVSDRALTQLTNKLQTLRSQLEVGSLDDAVQGLQRFGVSLLKIEEAINVAAGAATSEIDVLTQKLNDAKNELQRIRASDPTDKYRRKDATKADSPWVKTKAGLDRSQLSLVDEKHGIARFASAKGHGETVDVNYGGTPESTNWSVNSAIRNLVKALEDGRIVLDDAVKKAAKELGYDITGTKPGEFAAKPRDINTERNIALGQYARDLAAAETRVTEAKLAVDNAEVSGEHITITSEEGKFTTPIPETIGLNKETNKIADDLAESKEKEAHASNLASNAAEQQRDAEDRLTKSLKAGTDAQNKQTNAVGRAVTTFFGYQMVLRQLRKLWREAIHTITELDKQLTNQAIVTNMTREETWKLVTTYQDLANATGLAQTTIAGVTTEYLRQGESLSNALTLTKAAAAAATVAGISAQDSVRYLTTAIHGFKLEAEDALAVSDKFAALAASAATNYEDLAVALSKVASQAALAGMSMDYTLALLTTGLDVTQEAPESIGTALKTVIARMREISDYGKTLEDNTDLNQVEDGLKAVNIELRNGEGELRSTESVLDELGHKWATLTANQQAAVAKALAGTRQQSRLVAIMENYDKVLENQARSMGSLGATTAQQAEYLKGMEAATNRLQNAYQSLITRVVKSDEAIGVVNVLTKILEQAVKFLNQPAGRASFIFMVVNMLTRSKELMTRIKGTIDQLVKALSDVNKQERAITIEKEKQVKLYSQSAKALIGASGKNSVAGLNSILGKNDKPILKPNDLARLGYINPDTGALQDSTLYQRETPLSNNPNHANFSDLLGSLFRFGPGYGQRVSATWKGYSENNSPWAKLGEARAQGRLNKAIVTENLDKIQGTGLTVKKANQMEDDAIAAEQKLAELRKASVQATETATKAAEEYNNALTGDEYGNVDPEKAAAAAAATEAADAQEAAAKKAVELAMEEAKVKRDAADDAQKQAKILSVLQSKQLTNAQKVDYLKKKELLETKKQELAEKKKTLETQKQGSAEAQETQENIKQLEAEIKQTQEDVEQTEKQSTGEQTGGKFSNVMKGASAIGSAVTTAVAWTQEIVDQVQNGLKDAANAALEKAQEIEAEIYENTQQITTIDSLTKSFDKLNRQVIKTADDMKELEEVRTQLLETLNLTEQEAKGISTQALRDRALAERERLEAKNQQLVLDLGNQLLGAANNYDALGGAMNILTKTAMGAGIGGSIGSLFPGLGTAIGTAVGAGIGAIVGGVEEIIKGIQANDAKGKVHETLQTDEGVKEFRNLINYVYEKSESAGEYEAAIRSTYAGLVNMLSGEQIEGLLEQYNWDMRQLSDGLNNALIGVKESVGVLNDEFASYVDKADAVEEVYNALAAESKELADAYIQQYAPYIELKGIMAEHMHYMDDYKWSMTGIQAVLSQLADDGMNMTEEIGKLGAALKDCGSDTSALEEATKDWSVAARNAAAELITGGQSMQDVADRTTLYKNKVNDLRNTQAKWGDMSASDRRKFINDNEAFFNIDGAREAFYNGEDISKYLKEYRQQLQEALRGDLNNQIQAAALRIENAQEALNKLGERTEENADKYNEAAAALKTAERDLEDLKDDLEDVNNMFDLTLSEIVDKQNQQIAKMKEMYQAEEKALTESLQKRKEAYQDYFNSLQQAERIQEYEESRDQLMTSIAKLSGGTDANSRNKMRDLQRQLQDLEKQEAQQRKEDARQAVLDNIDDQISDIQKKFDELLGSNEQLLASINEGTYMQYLSYLATTGKTQEEQDLIKQQMADLLNGKWTADGLVGFSEETPETTTPKSAVQVTSVETDASATTVNITSAGGKTESIKLTQAEMRELLTQMINTLNDWKGLRLQLK